MARAGALVLAVLVATAATAWAGVQNDADSGTDAGDTPDVALRVASPTTFTGDVSDPGRVDWYGWKYKTDVPACAEVRVSGQTLLDARVVSVDANKAREAYAKIVTARPARMGLAAPTMKMGFVEIRADPLAPDSLLAYGVQLGTLTTATAPAGDSGSGSDAPGTRTAALSGVGGCVFGRIDSSTDVDVYQWTGQAGDRVMVSLAAAGTGAQAQILSATDVLITIASGQLATVTLPTSGTYYMSASSSSSTGYAMGLCEPNCGPPESPCNPMCMLASAD